jgi:hypothetical protein
MCAKTTPPAQGQRHGLKSDMANFRTTELGNRACCCALTVTLVCWHCCLFIFIKIVL